MLEADRTLVGMTVHKDIYVERNGEYSPLLLGRFWEQGKERLVNLVVEKCLS